MSDQQRSTSLRLGWGKSKLTPRDISDSLGKLPPQVLDLEESVLGAVLLEREPQIQALELLTPEDFYSEVHKEIFQAVTEIAQEGKFIEMKAVIHQLRKTGKLELVGGAYFVMGLQSKVSSTANVKEWALIIQEQRMKRDLINLASLIHHEAYDDTTDVFKLLDDTDKNLHEITKNIKGGQIKHVKHGITALAESANKRTADSPEITGVPSGYFAIDKVTRGWQAPDFIIIAGRPSMGKTTFVLNCARNAAIDFKIPVGIFSMEMSYQQLVDKLCSMETDIDLKVLRTNVLQDHEWTRFHHKTNELAMAPMYIDDSAALTIGDLRVRTRKMYEEYGVRIIVIDYLQLMKGSNERDNREQEISKISRGCKQIAKELNIPVIALSQLSRKVDDRPLPRIPMLADLRESGSLEQDADIVGFLWRPDYYKISGDDKGTFVQGLTKLILAKHRNGELAEPAIAFRGRVSKFMNIDSPYEGQVNTFKAPELFDRPKQLVDYAEPKPKANDPDDVPF